MPHDEALKEIMRVAKGVMSDHGNMSPIILFKFSGREEFVFFAPDLSSSETKSNTVDMIKIMIRSGRLERFFLVCEASAREDGKGDAMDCILVMDASRSGEVMYACDIIRGEDTSFGEWRESKSTTIKQGLFNNLFDRVICSDN